ncbi:hypothetical protein CHARACLAT_031515, partial [Characodon lateralis]|nr:hypothetical protein [Characodon lateralis]
GDRQRDIGAGGDRQRDIGAGGDRQRDIGAGGDRQRDIGTGGDRQRDIGTVSVLFRVHRLVFILQCFFQFTLIFLLLVSSDLLKVSNSGPLAAASVSPGRLEVEPLQKRRGC